MDKIKKVIEDSENEILSVLVNPESHNILFSDGHTIIRYENETVELYKDNDIEEVLVCTCKDDGTVFDIIKGFISGRYHE